MSHDSYSDSGEVVARFLYKGNGQIKGNPVLAKNGVRFRVYRCIWV